MNGMYASQNGGGITIIQVKKIHHKNFLELLLTGQQGDVMKESMHVAKTVAWNLLNLGTQNHILTNWKDTGIHLHCPEGATPKDGPSAGGAITLCILSSFLEIPIRHDIAMTGEIELNGNITAIGGLDMKLTGAKKAGVKLAFIPEENEEHLKQVVAKIPSLIDENFQVKIINHITDVLEFAFNDTSYLNKINI
jgi:ATP-dependent Lon protease